MNTTTRMAAALAVAAGAAALSVLPATAGPDRRPTSFTIDTQFVEGPSDIVAATGPLASCTEVLDLENSTDLRTHNQLAFTGVKELTCGEATVTIGYNAFVTLPAFQTDLIPAGGAFTTHGDWWVLESTLAGVSSGGGKLMGDNRSCTLDEGSDGCIADTFWGFVS